MATLESAAPTPAGTGPGIVPAESGQARAVPAASVSTQPPAEEPRRETPATPAEEPKAPSWESELGWKSREDAERDYKQVQAWNTKLSQQMASLGDLNELTRERQILAELRNDPEFLSWVEARIAKEQAGDSDPETIKALQIVDARAKQIAEQAIAPMRATLLEQKTKTIFSEMDTAYGKEWRDKRGDMNALHQSDIRRGFVAPQADQRFDFDYVDALYKRVLASDPDYAAKQYQRKLAHKQSQATQSQPGAAPSTIGDGKATTFEAAYANAKRSLGLA